TALAESQADRDDGAGDDEREAGGQGQPVSRPGSVPFLAYRPDQGLRSSRIQRRTLREDQAVGADARQQGGYGRELLQLPWARATDRQVLLEAHPVTRVEDTERVRANVPVDVLRRHHAVTPCSSSATRSARRA